MMDLTGATLGLTITGPILMAGAAIIKFTMGSPVFFRQSRPGRHAKPFTVLKFRTMNVARDSNGALLPDADRLTSVGRFLRATSIDELPQLFNVIKGDLSLVGPRPLLHQYLSRYSAEQARRHEVLPGITGWAQVNGRNALTWEEKFKLDIWYVDRWSLGLDFKILLKTVMQVVRRQGISNDGHVTMPEFFGNTEFREP
jgi:lipopolysaccharide/colanic/teichoic acid biosynthesis glycosyltransferase